jgi:predicted GTPase
MSRWRIVIVVALVVLPLLVLAGLGSLWLWQQGLALIAWWPMAGCMMVGYLLGWYWMRSNRLLKPPDFAPPMHWTDRDKQAWTLVEARAKAGEKVQSADMLMDPAFYQKTAEELALQLAQFYYPGTKDYIGRLTVPELLAVGELVAHDLAEMVDQYVPGSHVMTINDWKRAKKALDWVPAATNAYWLVSAIVNPLNTALRYAASQAGLASAWQMLQQNVVLWFYTAFVHRLGTYLIELNSGRLRVGATRYRELLRQLKPIDGQPVRPGMPVEPPPVVKAEANKAQPGETGPEARRITVTLFGQVKAGKSSLVNALLGDQRAITDVLPATAEIARYELQPPGVGSRLVLLDTVGYGHEGPKADQVRVTQNAVRESDVLLLVMHAKNPGRAADLKMLQELRQWLERNPQLKRPPLVGVVTHIDLLSPVMEWSPPYDWREAKRSKEQQIQRCLAAVQEQLGPFLDALVPVCAAPGKVYGIDEELLPVLTQKLDEAHAVAMLRCLKAETDTGKVRKVFDQLLTAGRQALKIAWEQMSK